MSCQELFHSKRIQSGLFFGAVSGVAAFATTSIGVVGSLAFSGGAVVTWIVVDYLNATHPEWFQRACNITLFVLSLALGGYALAYLCNYPITFIASLIAGAIATSIVLIQDIIDLAKKIFS